LRPALLGLPGYVCLRRLRAVEAFGVAADEAPGTMAFMLATELVAAG
jgi:hypothetical protein